MDLAKPKSGATHIFCWFLIVCQNTLIENTVNISYRTFKCVVSLYIFVRVMQYFGEPEGWVKIQMTSKNVQRCYKLKCLMNELLSNIFFPQNAELSRLIIFRAVLYSVLYEADLENN